MRNSDGGVVGVTWLTLEWAASVNAEAVAVGREAWRPVGLNRHAVSS